MILPHTYLVILWLEMFIGALCVIIEWFDAAIPSWTLHIVTRDMRLMISPVSPQWYWRQPWGGTTRESHLIWVTRILHFLQVITLLIGALWRHTQALPVIAGACGHGWEGGGRGTEINAFLHFARRIFLCLTCRPRRQGRYADQRCSRRLGE